MDIWIKPQAFYIYALPGQAFDGIKAAVGAADVH